MEVRDQRAGFDHGSMKCADQDRRGLIRIPRINGGTSRADDSRAVLEFDDCSSNRDYLNWLLTLPLDEQNSKATQWFDLIMP